MHKIRTLIVEDNPLILTSLVETLQELVGAEIVGTAADERSALAWMDCRTNGCDVVIVDVFLKEGSGLGVLRGMQQYESPPIRVVLTNYATADLRERCLGLGAEVVFDKSNEITELLQWLGGLSPTVH